MVMISAKKTSDGHLKALECEDTGELRVVICGKQIDGTITPILVDEDGKIITST